MAFEPRDNSGVIFRNDKRESEKHPTHSGSATIGGREFWISAWVKEGKNGKFFSLAFKPKNETQQRRQDQPRDDRSYADALDDEIPF
jgi:hypothetical protein